MSVIDDLDERLYFTPLLEPLLAHSSCRFSGITFHTGNDSVWVGSFFRSFIELFDYNDFLSSLASLKDDGDLNKRIHDGENTTEGGVGSR